MTKSTCSLFKILVAIAIVAAVVFVGATFSTAQETPATETETPAVETKTPAPEPLPPIDPRRSFSRLAHPSVASRVHLTDAQSVDVQRLLSERAQQLAKAPADQWNTVIHANEKQLEAILTPPQRALWEKVFSEKTIRPIFKFQNWEQVLSWTAEQVGLQLVMDSPPPGTFDYAADRDYTPTEYLDMLNSVLQRKGYALVRYQKMLMLFNLSRGKIPVQFLPKVKPEDLDERGAFEFVTCTFSLERRDQAAVILSMTPFQGQYFSYIPMPGNSLLVTDTVGNLQVMWKVAESVNNPPKPDPPKPEPPKPDPPKPPPPVWEAYTITGIDVSQAEKIIKEFVGDAKVLRIENSSDVHYFTQPGNHATIKQIVDIINKDGSESNVTQRTVVAYTLEAMRMSMMQRGFRQRMNQWQQGGIFQSRDEATAAAASVVTFLKEMLPTAVVVPQPIMGKVVVFAEEADHTKIRDFFESLAQQTEPPAESRIEARVYRPANTKTSRSLSDTVQAISTLIPSATVTAESSHGVVIVVGTVAEHELVADTFSGMEALADDRIVSTYSTQNLRTSQVQALVAQSQQDGVFASALIVPDTQRRRVIVFGTEKQHAEVAKLFGAPLTTEEMTQAGRDAIAYTPTALSPYTLATIVRDMFPDLEVSRDDDRIVVRGTPADVAEVRTLLEQIDQGDSGRQYPKTYPLKNADPYAIMRMINRLYQDATATYDYANRSVMVEASRITHEKIEALIASLDPDEQSPNALEVKFYSLYTKPTDTLLSPLRQMVPAAQIVADTRGKQIMVVARPSDQKLVAEHLATILESFNVPEEAVLQIYSVTAEQRRRLNSFITSARVDLPTLQVISDTTPGQMSVWATPKEHELVSTILDQFAVSADENPVSLRIFLFSTTRKMSTAESLISQRYPDAQVFQDSAPRRLFVWGSPSTLEKIAEAIQALDGPQDNVMKVYPAIGITLSSLQNAVLELYPAIKITNDHARQQLIVWGSDEQHEQIEAVVNLLNASETGNREVRRFAISRAEPYSMIAMVSRLYPSAAPVYDSLNRVISVEASPIVLDKIATLLKSLDPDEQSPNAPEVKFYSLYTKPTDTLLAPLRQLVPTAQIVPDVANKQIMVIARPVDQKLIAENLKIILESFTIPEEPVLQIYRVSSEQQRKRMTAFITTARAELPTVQVIADTTPGQMSILATPKEHSLLATTYEEFAANEISLEPKVYPLKNADPYATMRMISQLYQDATATYDYVNRGVLVEASRITHEKIEALLASLDPDEPSPNAPEVKFYSLYTKPTDTLLAPLRQLVPTAQIVPDVMNKQIMVIARPVDQKLIAENLKIILESFTIPEEPILQIYHVSPTQQRRLNAFITTARAELPTVQVVADTTPGQMSIWATPKEHALLTTTCEEFAANETPLDVRSYGAIGATVHALQTAILELYPTLKISPDNAKQQLLVWATTEQHEQIEAVVNLLNASETGNREVRRFAISRAEPYSMIAMVSRLYPSAAPVYDSLNRVISVEASPIVLDKIATLLKSLDPDEQSPNAPEVKFYSLYTKPTDTLLAPLRQLVPTAQIVPDVANKQIMVIARPVDQKLIAENLKIILESFTIPEEPILQIYTVSAEQKRRIEVFIVTARTELPTVQVVTDITPGQLSVWATPTEHALIETILAQLASSEVAVPMALRVFTLASSDVTTTQQLIRRLHPDAAIIPDVQRNRLFVWAREETLDAVAASLQSQEQSDSRQLLEYPAVGTTTATLQSLVHEIYPGLKMTDDTARRRLLVWAMPEEHVRIGQVVEQANANALGDPTAELSEKFVPYNISGIELASLTKILESFLPNLPIQSDAASGRIIVLARSREHERIRELIEQLKATDTHRLCSLRAYQYGESNPVMLEAYLRGAFPEAESFSSDDLVQQLSQSFMMERYWDRYQESSRRGNDTATKQNRGGFYKVDTKSRSVYAYLSEDDHTLVAKSIEEIAAVAELEASKTLTRRYVLEETSFYEVQDLFSQIAPSAIFRPLYVPSGRRGDGSRDWSSSYRDFLAYATESDQQKIEQLVSELNEATSAMGRREVITLSIPSGARISRVKLIEALTRLYPATDPAEGTEPSQITLWARSHLKERIQSVFAELCRDIPEDQRAFIKSYPLKHIPATQAVRWIKNLCPNASIEEGGAARSAMDPSVAAQSSTISHTIIALAAKGDHAEITKALAEIDIPLTSDVEPTPKVYDLSNLPPNYFFWNVISLRQAVPGIVALGTGVPGQIVVWATDDEHRKVASVLQQVLAESPETNSQMEIYTLANGFTTEIRKLVELLIPNAVLTDGTQLNQLVVWAKLVDQKKVKDLIDRLQKEEAARDVAFYPVPVGMVYLVYSTVRDYISYRGLAADITYDYAGNRLMVVATAEEQEIVAKLIGEVGTHETDFEVFSLRSVDLESAQMGLNALFASESYYTKPTVEIDVYSNTIFVQGTKPQIEAARKTLVKMGETHLLEDSVPQSTSPRSNSGQIRVLKIEGGNLVNTIRELERLWPQMSASPLVIQRESRPLIQKKEEDSNSNSGQFSVPDRVENEADNSVVSDSVYMTIGDDGSLTIVSYDETALDLLEEVLTRINSRIVDEGRDYTIYSVKNISAALVHQKIQLVMRSRMQTRIQWQQQAARYGRSTQSVIPLEILPDLTTNTIYVRGSRADRQEVGRLITMYDVSDLPGERTVRKPIYVTIQNAEAYRIYQQVMNVYQQKMQSTSLPGGVMPRITIDQLTNSLVIIAPEPLATELKEYAEDLDKRIMTEPGRKIQVIPLEVKGAVIRQAIQVIRQSQSGGQIGGGVMMPGMSY